MAFESGYGSLSGFVDSFRKTAAFSPGTSYNHQLIQTRRIVTPLGPMLAGANQDGICLLEFMDVELAEARIKGLSRYLDARLMPGTSSYLDLLNDQLDEYFSGNRRNFNIPLVLSGTPFQRRVWAALQDIAYGSTCSCRQQAESIGALSAVSSVARANDANRIAILVPSHRVVGRNGGASRNAAGSWRKRFLLKLESGNIA